MFAKLLAAVLPLAAQLVPIISVPLQKQPRRVEQVIAPIETAGPAYAAACKGSDDWDKPAPPVNIFGNTYLVGTCGITAILIVGSAGSILIDSGTDKGASLIADNIRELGFKPTDVKILLHSHEHHDHVGGMARMQRLTGAQLYASPAAAAVFATGAPAADDPQAGSIPPFPAPRVDHVIREGEMVRLGDLTLIPIATPGHTSGALSWRWGSCRGGICRQIIYADSLTPVSRKEYRFSDHPERVAMFRSSIAKVAALDCDILLTPHPAASAMPERLAGSAPIENRNGCRDYAASLTKRLDDRLAEEAAGK